MSYPNPYPLILTPQILNLLSHHANCHQPPLLLMEGDTKIRRSYHCILPKSTKPAPLTPPPQSTPASPVDTSLTAKSYSIANDKPETSSEINPHLHQWITYIKSILTPYSMPPTPVPPTQIITSRRQRTIIRTLRETIKDLQAQIFKIKTTTTNYFCSFFMSLLYTRLHSLSPNIYSTTLQVNNLLDILSSINFESLM